MDWENHIENLIQKIEKKNSKNHSDIAACHYSNLTPKNMKMCEQISKKTAPQYNSNSLNGKNSLYCKKKQENANNSPSYRCAAVDQHLLLLEV